MLHIDEHGGDAGHFACHGNFVSSYDFDREDGTDLAREDPGPEGIGDGVCGGRIAVGGRAHGGKDVVRVNREQRTVFRVCWSWS